MDMILSVELIADNLRAREGEVLEPVPESERKHYRHWRAQSYGAVALNFLTGKRRLNPTWGANYTYFQQSYLYAQVAAEGMVKSEREVQIDSNGRELLNAMLDIPTSFAFPSAVIALGRQYNNSTQLLPTERLAPEMPEDMFTPNFLKPKMVLDEGREFPGNLTLPKIDGYSCTAIKKFLGLPHSRKSRWV
jgi:hypothetical protein